MLKPILSIINRKINGENFDEYDKFEGYFYFIQFLIFFLIRTNSEVYYKHQNFSFAIFFVIGFFKAICFFINNLSKIWAIVIIQIIISILHALYFIYIKELMKYKFISPYKCNFMIGIINFPLIIIIYVIISFTKLGEKNNNIYYWDSIFELFKSIKHLNLINIIRLISLPIVYGIYVLIINKTIYDLISFFCIEFIMILIFLEIIEIKLSSYITSYILLKVKN